MVVQVDKRKMAWEHIGEGIYNGCNVFKQSQSLLFYHKVISRFIMSPMESEKIFSYLVANPASFFSCAFGSNNIALKNFGIIAVIIMAVEHILESLIEYFDNQEVSGSTCSDLMEMRMW